MACACKKVQDNQNKLIDINNRLAQSTDRVERTRLKTQKTVIEAKTGIRKSIVYVIFKRLMQLIFQVPFMLIAFVLVAVFIFVHLVISVLIRTLFHKEIGGIVSPFAIYANLKNSAIASSIKNMKQKIEDRKNGLQ